MGCRTKLVGTLLVVGALTCFAGCSREDEKQSYRTIDDLPECDRDRLNFDCIKQLFLPLRTTEWPFDRDAVDRAYTRGRGSTEVVSGWHLTALHVIDGNAPPTEPADCFSASFEFAEPGKVIERKNCGPLLFLGGHPVSAACKAAGKTLMSCVDRVPVAETFDIGLVAGPPTGQTLEVRSDVQVGEEVFIVGDPLFLTLLQGDESAYIASLGPLVSAGKVLQLDGRGMVLSNMASFGNSGGPVLDKAGRVVGVVYTLVRHLRLAGTATDPDLAGHRTVAVRIDSEMKARIDSEAASSRAR